MVGRAALHFWEEPCLSGTQDPGAEELAGVAANVRQDEDPAAPAAPAAAGESRASGSGAVFFAGCSLGCVYCQNRELSRGRAGVPVSDGRLAEIFLELQEKGALNINLVTGDHFAPQIAQALQSARAQGLTVPAVWNCSGYQSPECLALLDGLIDIYLTDLKYMRPETAARYSNAPDYPDVARAALAEMVRQQPEPVFGPDGAMERGVIVRHLLLPGHVKEAKEAVRYVHETYGERVMLSLMSQYTPMPASGPQEMGRDPLADLPELRRPVTRREYDSLVSYALDLGVENGFIQEGGAAKESFIPAFDGEGVRRG